MKYIKSYSYIGINNIQQAEETEFWDGSELIYKYKGMDEHISASHVLTLCSNEWQYCFKEPKNNEAIGVNYCDPNQDVGIMIWCQRKLLGRNPGCSFLYHDDNLYHIATWIDIHNIKVSNVGARMCRIRDKKLTLFIMKRTEKDLEIMLNLINEEKPEYRIF